MLREALAALSAVPVLQHRPEAPSRSDARASGDRVLELRGLTRLACDYLEHGDVASADAAIAQRASLAESLGLPRYRWQTPLLRSMRAMPVGRWNECSAAVEEARAVVREGGLVDPNAERTIAVHSFFLALASGKPDALRECEAEIQRVMAPTVEGPRFRPVFAAAVLARNERDVEVARATLLTNDDPLTPTSRA